MKPAFPSTTSRPSDLVRKSPKLPDELWRCIFEEYAKIDGQIITLLRVCRRWRDVALITQRLWRRILLSGDTINKSLRQGSVHACNRVKDAQTVLKRSGTMTPLELTLVLGPDETATIEPSMRSTLFSVVGNSHLHRLTFLCVIINPQMTLPQVTESLKGVFKGSLISLESMMIASAFPIGDMYGPLSDLFDVIENTSTKLRSVYFENVNKDFLQKVSAMDFWTRLTRITIKNEHDAMDASQFALCKQLEFLSFSGEFSYGPSNFDKTIHFPDLKWLKVGLITMGTLVKLHLPQVHSFVIDCLQANYPNPPPAPHSYRMPELKILHIATVNPTIKALVAPKLETLCLAIPTLKSADANSVFQAVFDGNEKMLKPRNLTITAPINDNYLLAALARLPDLCSLTLDHQLTFTKSLFRALTPPVSLTKPRGLLPRAKRVKKPLLCPKLKCLILDLHKISPTNQDTIRAALDELIQGRKNAQEYEPLCRVAVRLTDGPTKLELINPPLCYSCNTLIHA
ncbi:hypothetical protein CPB86DRAFT_305142 [Serendipita vermifera]|nr:hypothetical protein CPB86DRAFT_305142 [Serendipita vermifera]